MPTQVSPSTHSLSMGFVRLTRPANIVTACADICAGYAAAYGNNSKALPLLLLATAALYGGGVVFNDFFDADLDAVERPERPIPSGTVSKNGALTFGLLLLGAGIVCAWQWSVLSGIIAIATALAAVGYDRIGKHQSILGPVNMGLCRALNFLLGVTAGGRIEPFHCLLAAVPLCYIAGITSLSRGEVKGGTRTATMISAAWLTAALLLYLTSVIVLGPSGDWWTIFAAALVFRLFDPFRSAFRLATPLAIRGAVKRGVLSLILLDASLAAVFAGPWYSAGVVMLYLPAALLAKLFAVT